MARVEDRTIPADWNSQFFEGLRMLQTGLRDLTQKEQGEKQLKLQEEAQNAQILLQKHNAVIQTINGIDSLAKTAADSGYQFTPTDMQNMLNGVNKSLQTITGEQAPEMQLEETPGFQIPNPTKPGEYIDVPPGKAGAALIKEFPYIMAYGREAMKQEEAGKRAEESNQLKMYQESQKNIRTKLAIGKELAVMRVGPATAQKGKLAAEILAEPGKTVPNQIMQVGKYRLNTSDIINALGTTTDIDELSKDFADLEQAILAHDKDPKKYKVDPIEVFKKKWPKIAPLLK